MMKILVLDANQRSALAVVRSLGNKGHEIYSSDDAHTSLAGSSRFSKHYLMSPSPVTQPQAYIDWVMHTIMDYSIEMVIPVTEYSSQLLLRHRNHLPYYCQLPYSDISTVMALADKSSLMRLADKLDIPHPKSDYYNSHSELNISSIHEYPVVLKPCLSHIYTGNSWIQTKVTVCNTASEVCKQLEQDYFRYPFMLQEFIPGTGAGIFTLYNHGQAVTFFAHRRLREKPPQGGVSVLSESVECDSRLIEYSKSLLKWVQWHGVAMIEFRMTEDNSPYLMEINTRFWGSLQLSIDSGVDFPHLLQRIAAGKNCEQVQKYKVGQQLRWLLGDLDSLYLYLCSKHYTLDEKIRSIYAFLYPQFHNRRMEINRWNDPRPFFFEMKRYLADMLGK